MLLKLLLCCLDFRHLLGITKMAVQLILQERLLLLRLLQGPRKMFLSCLLLVIQSLDVA